MLSCDGPYVCLNACLLRLPLELFTTVSVDDSSLENVPLGFNLGFIISPLCFDGQRCAGQPWMSLNAKLGIKYPYYSEYSLDIFIPTLQGLSVVECLTRD